MASFKCGWLQHRQGEDIGTQEDTYFIDLANDRSPPFHVEFMFPGQEADLDSDWGNWQIMTKKGFIHLPFLVR